eukprot:TRINITY_DN8418_c0_g1_i5.p2 TRINITY_DN8418_c0_g1~~TRINITY_DN8418_c0_g1_i5.p2  ORF type:complete len:129 (-),score=13.38 TRINITY_DN8418_c0_g1_i5:11-397(-)
MDAQAAALIGAGLAAIGMIGAGIGVGNVWGNLISAVARNPGAKKDVELYGWIGFAVTEAIALFALIVALMVLFSQVIRGRATFPSGASPPASGDRIGQPAGSEMPQKKQKTRTVTRGVGKYKKAKHKL